ncbi:hypothetical protein [Nostoc sp.]
MTKDICMPNAQCPMPFTKDGVSIFALNLPFNQNLDKLMSNI